MKPLIKKLLLTLLAGTFSISGYADTYYVAPNGNDTDPGTLTQPFLTIGRAQKAVLPGDTVYIRGGNYQMQEGQIMETSSVWAYVTALTKSGTADARINYWAYPGEQPVFEYSDVKPEGYRVVAFYVSGSYIHIKGIEVVGVQVTITDHTQSECFSNYGNHNIYENLRMHDGMAIGLYIHDGTDNLILNCDAYRNWDSVSEGGKGGNTDGFGSHSTTQDAVNTFRGCRAWLNSDDGFDCIHSTGKTIFDHCWAVNNGYRKNTSGDLISVADGNGFKAGGYAASPIDQLPDSIPRNTVQFCLAVVNKAYGFYANHHLNGDNWYNNSAYQNAINFNMVNRKHPDPSDYLPPDESYNYDLDVPGYDHMMKNNLSFDARYADTANIDTLKSDISYNSFSLSVAVSADDFVSLDTSLLTQPRKPDGSLPDIDFMHLKKGSDLIDVGKDIGFDFNGAAPDLGCFESPYRRFARKPQTITFNPIPGKSPDSTDFIPDAVAGSGLPVQFSSSDSDVAVVADGKIHITGIGAAAITASQPGDSVWLPADEVTQVLTVTEREVQVITFNVIPDQYLGAPDLELTATAGSGLPVTYESNNPVVAVIKNGKVHFLAVGPVTIRAQQGGDSFWLPAETVSQSFNVKALVKPEYNKLLTPNGDGINDKLVVKHITAYPKNHIQVFDESGKLIYQKRGYSNDWDGRINGTVVTNGTYYFVLKSRKDIKIKGAITVIQ